MADHKIYLAGKVGGDKWEIQDWIHQHLALVYENHPPKHADTFQFLASDHNVTHEDSGLFDGPGIFGGNREKIKAAVVDKIAACDCLCAYIDTPDCYGTIAEIALASGMGKQCYVFLSFGDEQEIAVADTYRLVTNLPYVLPFLVGDVTRAAIFLYYYVLCESPIEFRYAMAMLFHKWTRRLPVPQLWIGDYRVDFAYTDEMVIVELDGHDYHSTKDQRAYDAKRDRFLQSQGWKVIRFTGSEVYKAAYDVLDEVNGIVNGIAVSNITDSEAARVKGKEFAAMVDAMEFETAEVTNG